MSDKKCDLNLYVNGKLFEVKDADPKWTLLQFLRQNRLTGTKLGCGEGGCGACTVMISNYDQDTHEINHYAANACLTPVCSLDGFAVTTVEGIGGMKQGLHPVQQRLASAHGSQCGFCTPGIVMSIYALLRAKPHSTPHEIEEALDGNLCRCTGYRPIIDAARSLSNNKQQSGGCCGGGGGSGGGCPCKEAKISNSEDYVAEQVGLDEAMTAKGLTEPIFPPSLIRRPSSLLCITKDDVTWHQPLTMSQLLELKQKHPAARLVVGNTEVGIEVKFKYMEYQHLINPMKVQELRVLKESTNGSDHGILVGSAVTLNKLRTYIVNLSGGDKSAEGRYKYRGLTAIVDMLSWFASNQIRNVACVGGNICTASPISDLNPMLIACGALLNLRSQDGGSRQVPISNFFLSYRKVDLLPSEVLENVFIPFAKQFEFILPYKQAKRREDDISIVNAGIRIVLKPESEWRIADCTLAFGGMAPTTVRAPKASTALIGKVWDFNSIESVFALLKTELALPENVPGGQSEYRMALTVSFLFKAYLAITQELNKIIVAGGFPPVPQVDSATRSGSTNFLQESKPYTRGEQSYLQRKGVEGLQQARPVPHELVKDESKVFAKSTVVGESVKHKSADLQVTGEAQYTDDMNLPANVVHAALVMSSKPHARILKVDTSAAEKCPGYVAYFSKKDVVGSNIIGAIEQDENVFADDIVTTVGAVIGIMICDTHEQAAYAARKVVVTYEDLPAIFSMAEAIESGSTFDHFHSIQCGNMSQERSEAEVNVSGTLNVGFQEHFYLETNATHAIPLENDLIEVYASCQGLAFLQRVISKVCGIPAAKIVAKCKRMGGGFGGKESRSQFISVTAALAAHLLKRPVSLLIERDVDMSITGQRHAFHCKYEAGMTADGSLKYLDAQIFNNGGFSMDLSLAVMERSLLHMDNVYKWPAARIVGKVCKTNIASNTAYRGFGAPQAFTFCEQILEHLSRAGKLDVDMIRHKNLYQEGDCVPCGQPLEQYYVPRLMKEIQTCANVAERRASVEEFNKNNRWRKRGISVLATKYGINFDTGFMNQGGALVHVYTDGTVLIAHGGNEMGQGLYTKMIQVAAQCFGIPHEHIQIAETATNTVANSMPTAASMSTDLYGMAVLDACEQITERLFPFKEKMPGADFRSIVNAAYFSRVNLSAQGFYKVKDSRCGMNWETSEPQCPFNYYTQGAACSEVEIDCLTGDSRVIRTDILMDLGKSINPAIDIGQIEGAFVQGMGWCTMEEMVWGDRDHTWVRPGNLFTKGPGTYKIPAFNDVPIDFRVHLADTDNRFAVHSSKAVGEPPFFLGCTVYFAIQNAIMAAREENKVSNLDYHLDMPATSERIRMGCADAIADLCTSTGSAACFVAKASY